MSSAPTLVIDANYLGYQALFTTGDLSTEDDIATGVVFGFLTRVLTLGQFFKTNDMIFCWDSKHSHRRKTFKGYKQKRRKISHERKDQLDVAFEQFKQLRMKILPKIGFANVLVQPGLEADDLIADICLNPVMDIVIVSADQDLYQCLSDNVRMWSPSVRKMMTGKRLQENYNVSPSEWKRVKAMAGCSSDSVPGVQGVGEKTAIKYIRGFLKSESKAHIAIKENGDLIKRNMKLVSLPHRKTESIKVSGTNNFNFKAFRLICRKCGFESFLQRDWEAFFDGNFAKESIVDVMKRRHAK